MFVSPAEASPYVLARIDPVIGTASCKAVLVVVISLLKKFLNVLAIILFLILHYAISVSYFTNLTGMSILYPVVTPVTLTFVSIKWCLNPIPEIKLAPCGAMSPIV